MSEKGWRRIDSYEKIFYPRGGTAMAEQIQSVSVEEPQTTQEDSTAATLAEFARLLYRVANDITYPDVPDTADRKSQTVRES